MTAKELIVDTATAFRWPVVVTVVVAAMALATNFALAKSADSCCTELRDAKHSHELRLQRVEDAQAANARALERIEKKLDELRERPR